MRPLILACLIVSSSGCARVVAPAPAARAPVATAEPAVTPPPQLVQRRIEPSDPPPVFLDPERRARLEAAFPAIDAYLQQTVARDRLVGLAAGIVIDSELAWFRGYGHRDPERGLPVERDTVFGVGSITKTFTTLALLKLRDEGRLDLDRPAAIYLPELDAIAYPTADSPPITIRHLLTHTSGLPRMGNFAEYPATPPGRAEFLATLAGVGLDRPPGQRYVYSNFGVQLLGPLVEAVAGVDHRTYIRDAIFTPLGMGNTAFIPEDVPGDRIAVGHERLPGQEPRPRPHWRPGATDAAGGAYSSVQDLARYAAFNLAAWPARDEPDPGPVRRATLREAHTLTTLAGFSAESMAHAPARASVHGIGLGFSVRTDCRYDHVVAHNGKTLNYRSMMLMLPTRGVAVILMTNLSSISSRVLPADAAKVLDLLADTGALEPRKHAPSPDLLAAAARLGALIGQWDDAAHASLFSADFRDAYPTETTANELAEWRALVGACSDPRALTLEEPRAGAVELTCERGVLRVELRVAPWPGAPITSFDIDRTTGLAPAPELARAAERSLLLLHRWNGREFKDLFTAKFSVDEMRRGLADAAEEYGRCRLAAPHVLGARKAAFALTCERGAPTLSLELAKDDPTKIAWLDLREQRDGPCR
ncbi:serine hydrolase domain-containing protein [Nannocystis pusilla]|uniref:Beta-lactamase family protein n=1 Tax=Nannocystis pusilla TaxID=889268 RepID=A0ABS7TPL2_9BACT|nr:serine hydrolase domain-containing protein [Nannocystis pusilla]MBZ5710157.1 beta-lactamase family protein [Nannocystis pusilla]